MGVTGVERGYWGEEAIAVRDLLFDEGVCELSAGFDFEL